MVLGKAELAADDRANRRDPGAVKLDTLVTRLHLHAVKHPHEIEMPEGAPRLAIGDDLEADIFLHPDQVRYGGVLDGAELSGGHMGIAGFGDRLRAKKTANMICAERGDGHGVT